MNVTKPASWDRNLGNREVKVLENFTPLAVKTASGPGGDIFGEARQNKGSKNQPQGRMNTRERDIVSTQLY